MGGATSKKYTENNDLDERPPLFALAPPDRARFLSILPMSSRDMESLSWTDDMLRLR
jgi:hypothetical protein